MSKLNVNAIEPSTGTDITLGASGDTITVPSGATFTQSGTMNASAITAGTVAVARGGTGAATFAAAGLDNTPAFSAKATGNQTGLTSGGWTKVQFDTEAYDTDSAYDNATDKFTVPAGKGGKYFFTSSAKINSAGGSTTLLGNGLTFYVNGANAAEMINFYATGVFSADGINFTAVLSLSATDYVEVYAYYQDNGGGTGSITGNSDLDTWFTGFKLIG